MGILKCLRKILSRLESRFHQVRPLDKGSRHDFPVCFQHPFQRLLGGGIIFFRSAAKGIRLCQQQQIPGIAALVKELAVAFHPRLLGFQQIGTHMQLYHAQHIAVQLFFVGQPGEQRLRQGQPRFLMPQRPDSASLLYLEGIPLAQVMAQRRQHEIQRLLCLFPQGCRLVQHQHGMIPHVPLGMEAGVLRNANQCLHLREPVVQLVHFPQHPEKHRRVLPFQQRLF